MWADDLGQCMRKTKTHNLNHRLTFVGRQSEHAALLSLIEEHTLVTVLGTGGLGKTTLANEVGRAWVAADIRREAWFVDAAGCVDEQSLLAACCDALSLELASYDEGFVGLGLALSRRRSTLLILDNVEQGREGRP